MISRSPARFPKPSDCTVETPHQSKAEMDAAAHSVGVTYHIFLKGVDDMNPLKDRPHSEALICTPLRGDVFEPDDRNRLIFGAITAPALFFDPTFPELVERRADDSATFKRRRAPAATPTLAPAWSCRRRQAVLVPHRTAFASHETRRGKTMTQRFKPGTGAPSFGAQRPGQSK